MSNLLVDSRELIFGRGPRLIDDSEDSDDVAQTYLPTHIPIHLTDTNTALARNTKQTLPSANRFWDWVRRTLAIEPERSSGVQQNPSTPLTRQSRSP